MKRSRVRVFRVRGHSLPTSAPHGSWAVATPTGSLRPGGLVIAGIDSAANTWTDGQDATAGWLIKKIERVEQDQQGAETYWLASERVEGTLDSRRLGACPHRCIQYVVPMIIQSKWPFVRIIG